MKTKKGIKPYLFLLLYCINTKKSVSRKKLSTINKKTEKKIPDRKFKTSWSSTHITKHHEKSLPHVIMGNGSQMSAFQ